VNSASSARNREKAEGCLLPFLFREQLRQRLEVAVDDAVHDLERFPVRMRAQNRLQQTIDDLAARIQRSQGDIAIGGDNLKRPARTDATSQREYRSGYS